MQYVNHIKVVTNGVWFSEFSHVHVRVYHRGELSIIHIRTNAVTLSASCMIVCGLLASDIGLSFGDNFVELYSFNANVFNFMS